MNKAKFITGTLVLLAATGGVIWLLSGEKQTDGDGKPVQTYGNVELRQVALPFNDSGRITAVLAEEGDRVSKGQILATMETTRIQPQLAQAQAQAEAQQQALERMENGSRPEEIALAKANADALQIAAEDTLKRRDRLRALETGSGVSAQDLDSAEAAAREAEAKAEAAQKNYELVLAGPRKEDIAQARAQLAATQAQVALLAQQLKDAQLTAPADAVVRTRVMEPGEMATPQKPVFTLAVTSPKWVRTYISERQLGRVKPGMKATVTCDSFPEKPVQGTVGFIADVAEFTPKTLQTEDLRTALVYEIRVLVDDPENTLRLGMPVSVRIND